MDKKDVPLIPSTGFGQLSLTSLDETHFPNQPAPSSFPENGDSDTDGKAKRPLEEAAAEPKTKRAKAASGKRARANARPRGMRQKMADDKYQLLIKPRNLGLQSKGVEPGAQGTGDSVAAMCENLGLDDMIKSRERASLDEAMWKLRHRLVPITPNEGPFILLGILTPLSAVQLTTVGWMMGREASKGVHGQGGIVAHGMGTGKTLINITLMGVNRTGLKHKKSENQCGTLIIVPSDAVTEHWLEELRKHTPEPFSPLKIARYRHLRRIGSVDALSRYDIVFATYAELRRGLPADKKRKQRKAGKPQESQETPTPPMPSYTAGDQMPLIFQAEWHRVILDEAHSIKNDESQTFLAVAALKKRHAWAVTATPLSNDTDELFPYFNFLGLKDSENIAKFRKAYFPNETASDKLKKTLAAVMTRYHPSDLFGGNEVAHLPASHISTIACQPNEEEKVVLELLGEKLKASVKKSLEDSIAQEEDMNEAMKKAKSSISGLLHNHRYASNHLFMLEHSLIDKFDVEDVKRIIEKMPRIRSPAAPSFREILELALNDKELRGHICLSCKEACESLQMTLYQASCGHIFCGMCLSKKFCITSLKCRVEGCGRVIDPKIVTPHPTLSAPFLQEEDDDNESESEPSSVQQTKRPAGRGRGRKAQKKPRGPSTDVHGNEPNLEFHKSRFLNYSDQFIKKTGSVVPSSKLSMLQSLLRQWSDEAPDDKIIVFTQFMLVARMVGRVARLENLPFLYYTGDMSDASRKTALDTFRSDPSVKVLVASLMCGGQALNITAANRVVLMELWWNSPAEEQAFSRSYRIGQEKEVYFVRLTTEGTKDDQMLEMQNSKELSLRNCLMSGKPGMSNHSYLKILSLVGNPIQDEFGRIIAIEKPEESDRGGDDESEVSVEESSGGEDAEMEM